MFQRIGSFVAVLCCLSLAARTEAYSLRFAGIGTQVRENMNPTGGAVLGASVGPTLDLDTTWDIDLVIRDAQVLLKLARVSFSTTRQMNALETMDVNFEATVNNLTLSMTPDGDLVWPVGAFTFGTGRLWGVYHSLVTSTPFDVQMDEFKADKFTLDFSVYPTSLESAPTTYYTQPGTNKRASTAARYFQPPAPGGSPMFISPAYSIDSLTCLIPFLTLNSVPESGDFNQDDEVNADDLVLWLGGFGTPAAAAQLQGDANYDGDVDGDDVLFWQRQLGTPPAIVTSMVPEPSTTILALLGIVAIVRRRHSSPAP